MSLLTRLRPPPDAIDAAAVDDIQPADTAPRRLAWRRLVAWGRGLTWRRLLGWTLTGAAALLVQYALVAPQRYTWIGIRPMLRIPVEGLVAGALLLILPRRARWIVAVLGGFLLGVLAVLNALDMGFFEVLDRPFNPLLDWTLLGDAAAFVNQSYGKTAETAGVIVAVLLAVAVPVLTALSVLRLTRLAVRYRTASVRGIAVTAVAWVACTLFGAQIVSPVPVAAHTAASLAYDQAVQLPAGIRDMAQFRKDASVDAFRNTPPAQLLTGLRGKDVIITFVESYGVVALQDPVIGPQVGALLDNANKQLTAAGYSARSAFLTSPTFGGGSWLAHSTLLSGLWINGDSRYSNLVASNRFTLNYAFREAGWHTVGVESAVGRSWPEGSFYRYNDLYTQMNLGYVGPRFNFASIPDQYTLEDFQRTERGPGHPPTMGVIVLLSSHAPWAPLPTMVPWDSIGNGSSFTSMVTGAPLPDTTAKIRQAYTQAIRYSLGALVSYILTYGDKNLVMVFLGDHQPASVISGEGASHDVPVTIVAHDPSALDRVAGWGWQDGIKPSPQAPVWRMDTFRDRFLTAFGPGGGTPPEK